MHLKSLLLLDYNQIIQFSSLNVRFRKTFHWGQCNFIRGWKHAMIFVNNPGVSAGRIGRSCGRRTFGTLSRNAQPYESEDSEESDNFLLGCTVASFGVAITLALVLLPLSICCSFLIYHPLFIFGVVLFFSLTLIGGILCVWHPVMTRCWWYKEDFCNRNTSRQASYTSR